MLTTITRTILFMISFGATLQLFEVIKVNPVVLICIATVLLILDFLAYYFKTTINWFRFLEMFTSGFAFGALFCTLSIISKSALFALVLTMIMIFAKEYFPHAIHKTELCITFSKEDLFAIQSVLIANDISHTVKPKLADSNDIITAFTENNLLYVLYVNKKDVEKAKKVLFLREEGKN